MGHSTRSVERASHELAMIGTSLCGQSVVTRSRFQFGERRDDVIIWRDPRRLTGGAEENNGDSDEQTKYSPDKEPRPDHLPTALNDGWFGEFPASLTKDLQKDGKRRRAT